MKLLDLAGAIDLGPPGGARSRIAAVGVLAVALLLVLLGLVLPLGVLKARLASDVAGYNAALAAEGEIERRKAELGQAAIALRNPAQLEGLLLSGASDAAATAALHERVRDLVAAVRANLISIEQLPPGEEGGQRRVSLRVQLACDLPGFQRIVYALEAGRPAVIVTNLYLRARTARASGMANPMDVQMDLVAYRKQGPA